MACLVMLQDNYAQDFKVIQANLMISSTRLITYKTISYQYKVQHICRPDFISISLFKKRIRIKSSATFL